MDEKYLIFSMLQRVYSCYDKIAKYLSLTYKQYSSLKYFGDFKDFSEYGRIGNEAKRILSTKEMQLLSMYRNNFSHNLRPGALIGQSAIELESLSILKVCFKGLIDCYELLKFMVTDSTKIGRNDPCPCESGKKFKKCCINKSDNN